MPWLGDRGLLALTLASLPRLRGFGTEAGKRRWRRRWARAGQRPLSIPEGTMPSAVLPNAIAETVATNSSPGRNRSVETTRKP